jgi:hypothetical protein
MRLRIRLRLWIVLVVIAPIAGLLAHLRPRSITAVDALAISMGRLERERAHDGDGPPFILHADVKSPRWYATAPAELQRVHPPPAAGYWSIEIQYADRRGMTRYARFILDVNGRTTYFGDPFPIPLPPTPPPLSVTVSEGTTISARREPGRNNRVSAKWLPLWAGPAFSREFA